MNIMGKKTRQIVNGLIGTLFILFAYFQLNDPDPLLWVALYGFIAVVSILAIFRPLPSFLVWIGLAITVVGILWYLPHFISWFQDGMPSITSSMKAESPFIEYTREFLGFVLCFVAMLWHVPYKKKGDLKAG